MVQVHENLIRRMLELSTPYFTDAMNRTGYMYDIRTVTPGLKVVGPAVTVRGFGTTGPSLLGIEAAKTGDVIVIDNGGIRTAAVWGELCSAESLRRGIRGVVIDGAIRDTAGIRQRRFPAFAAAVQPNVVGPGDLGEVNVPIQCGGVSVHPGDFIVGDDDGVVVIPSGKVEEVYTIAKAKRDAELDWFKQIESGTSFLELYPAWAIYKERRRAMEEYMRQHFLSEK